MSVGFATGYDSSLSVAEMSEHAAAAERAGFSAVMFSETIQLIRDSVTSLTAFSLATHSALLGTTQIARLRAPALMAQTMASVDELNGGRSVFVLGACSRNHAARFGLQHLDPVLTLTEWVAAVRLLLTSERVSFSGETVSFEDVGLGFRPVRSTIPIWIAATSATGLRLAGRIGDGVLLNAAASPAYTANAVAILKAAVAEAGRDWAGFRVAQIVNCSIEDDPRDAIDAMRWEVASKFGPLQYPIGIPARIRVGEPVIDPADAPKFLAAYEAGGMAGLAGAFPDSYVRGLTASGTPDDVRARVDEYLAAGVELPVLRPASRTQIPSLLRTFGDAPSDG